LDLTAPFFSLALLEYMTFLWDIGDELG
jgi:hypothetical protein